MYITNISLILDCEDDSIADAINEILRTNLRSFAPQSCLVDYCIGPTAKIINDSNGYDEGDAFIKL